MSGPGIDTPAGYTGTHRIGSGGGATVYRAWDERGMRWVALKLFHRYVRDQASATAFQEACQALVRLGAHPSIVAVHAVGVTPTGRAWQAMRLGEGGTLGEALLRTGPVDQAWALAAGARIADALAYAHGLAVPHGAVRLSNVLLDLESRPLLSDFSAGTISGTEWASPSGDVAGLGGVLFALLTGAMPQAGFGVRAGLATPGVQAVPGLSELLGAVLGVPAEAPVRSAREFGDRLREVQAAAGFAVSAADPGVAVVPEARRAERASTASGSGPVVSVSSGRTSGTASSTGGATSGSAAPAGGATSGSVPTAVGSAPTGAGSTPTGAGSATEDGDPAGGVDAGPADSRPASDLTGSARTGSAPTGSASTGSAAVGGGGASADGPPTGGLVSKPGRGLGFGLGRQRRRVLGTGFGWRSGGAPETVSPRRSTDTPASGGSDRDDRSAPMDESAAPAAVVADVEVPDVVAADAESAVGGADIADPGTEADVADLPETPDAAGTGTSRTTAGKPEVADAGSTPVAEPARVVDSTEAPANPSPASADPDTAFSGAAASAGSASVSSASAGSASAGSAPVSSASAGSASVSSASVSSASVSSEPTDPAAVEPTDTAPRTIAGSAGSVTPPSAVESTDDEPHISAVSTDSTDSAASAADPEAPKPADAETSADPGTTPPEGAGHRTIAPAPRRPWRTAGSVDRSAGVKPGRRKSGEDRKPDSDSPGRRKTRGTAGRTLGRRKNVDAADLSPIELMLRRDSRRRRITVATLTVGTLLIGAAALPATRSLIVDGLDRGPAPESTAPPAAGSVPPPVRAPLALPPDGVGGGLALWWAADEGTGTTSADGTSNSNQATLSDAAGWEPTGHGGKGSALRFSASTPDSFVAGARAAVRTDRSFTVTAWAYITDRRANRAIVSQPGVLSSAFIIRYDRAGDSWQALLPRADATGPDLDVATSTSTPQLRTWTHLALTFDAAAGKVTLYVDGRAEDTIRHPLRWHATGAIQTGRARVDGAWTDPFGGAIDDIRAYNRPLTAAEIASIAG